VSTKWISSIPDPYAAKQAITRAPKRSGVSAIAFVEENVRVLTPPCIAPRPILSDKNSQSDASALIVLFARLTKLQHPLPEFVASDRAPIWPTRPQFNAATTARHITAGLAVTRGWIAEYIVGALNATLVNVE
jgi:hypothetical protein